ncbi:MAG: GNAT family N-acetyltransferase [archaeon]
MEIQSVNEYDAAEILLLIHEHFPYMEMSFEQLVKRINHRTFLFQKSMEKENIAGFAEWQIPKIGERVIQLNGIVVKPWYQRKGHGRALLAAGEKWARQKGFAKIRLFVASTNIPAKKMYRASGFGFRKMHNRKIGGERAEVWEKPLK